MKQRIINTQEYSIIGVSAHDFKDSFEANDGQYDEYSRDLMGIVDTMDEGEWRFVASLMADELWDGDKYDNALWNAVQKLKTYRGETAREASKAVV